MKKDYHNYVRLLRCSECGYTDKENKFKRGDGRIGRHELHRYCPKCKVSIDWCGYSVISGWRSELRQKGVI